MSAPAYFSYDADRERRRLFLQSETLEDLSSRALAPIGPLEGATVLDVACGAMGVLRVLSRLVGPQGRVVGSDVSEVMIEHARAFCRDQGLTNVELVRDDIFATALPARAFDLVHTRFMLAPLGRDLELAARLERLVKSDGWIVMEEPESASWRTYPEGEAHGRLVAMVARAYDRHMGGFDAGRRLLPLAAARGWRDVGFSAEVIGLPPGHPYLACPVLMAGSLRAVLLRDTPAEELDAAVSAATDLYGRQETHGVTFTLLQVRGRMPTGQGPG